LLNFFTRFFPKMTTRQNFDSRLEASVLPASGNSPGYKCTAAISAAGDAA
jgi:hypothetical protein